MNARLVWGLTAGTAIDHHNRGPQSPLPPSTIQWLGGDWMERWMHVPCHSVQSLRVCAVFLFTRNGCGLRFHSTSKSDADYDCFQPLFLWNGNSGGQYRPHRIFPCGFQNRASCKFLMRKPCQKWLWVPWQGLAPLKCRKIRQNKRR